MAQATLLVRDSILDVTDTKAASSCFITPPSGDEARRKVDPSEYQGGK